MRRIERTEMAAPLLLSRRHIIERKQILGGRLTDMLQTKFMDDFLSKLDKAFLQNSCKTPLHREAAFFAGGPLGRNGDGQGGRGVGRDGLRGVSGQSGSR